jgi:hypothetical protein
MSYELANHRAWCESPAEDNVDPGENQFDLGRRQFANTFRKEFSVECDDLGDIGNGVLRESSEMSGQ